MLLYIHKDKQRAIFLDDLSKKWGSESEFIYKTINFLGEILELILKRVESDFATCKDPQLPMLRNLF